MLSEALYYPVRGNDVAGTMLVGGALCLFTAVFGLAGLATLIIPPLGGMLLLFALGVGVVLLGYMIRLLAAVATGSREAPSFTDWGSLVRSGVRALVLLVLVTFPVVAIGALTFGAVLAATAAEQPALALIALAGVPPLVVLVPVTAYLIPAALTIYAREGQIVDALRPDRLASIGLSVAYFKSWILAGAVLTVILPIAFSLSILLIGFPLAFYGLSVAASLHGQGYGIALGLRESGRPIDDPGPVDREEFVRGIRNPTAAVDREEFVRGVDDERTGRVSPVERDRRDGQPNQEERDGQPNQEERDGQPNQEERDGQPNRENDRHEYETGGISDRLRWDTQPNRSLSDSDELRSELTIPPEPDTNSASTNTGRTSTNTDRTSTNTGRTSTNTDRTSTSAPSRNEKPDDRGRR